MAVGISLRCLLDERLPDKVHAALAESGLAPSSLRLELTDTGATVDQETVLATLGRLRQQDVKLSIDAFGHRCTPLNQLWQLGADELKIHPTLTRGVVTDTGGATIVRGIIGLAHHLGMRVTADGIDDRRTLASLHQLDCDHAQGDAIAAPRPADDLAAARAEAEKRTRDWTGGPTTA